MLRISLVFVLVCGWLPALFAGAAAARQVAFVVGNDSYLSVPVLQKARSDAGAMATKLEALGFEVTTALDLDRDGMSRALVDLDAKIQPGDTVFFFFAGHGFAIDGENYLLPTDIPAAGPGEAELVRDAAFAVSRIVERLQRRGAATAILVLDACRNNPFERPGQRALSGQRGLVRIDPPQGVFVLFSAGSGQTALDRLSDNDPAANSVFTRVLLDKLDRPGLSLVRVAKETQVAVRSLAGSVGHDQTPAYYDQIVGDIVLKPGADGAAAAETPMPTGPTVEARLIVPPNPVTGAADLSRATLLYEEARAAEARGDALTARKAYLALMEADLDVVDPYLRFAALLRVQEGRAGAREVLGELAGRLKSPALRLVHLLQFDDAERQRRLADFLKEAPSYGPALYLAAAEYTADRLGREPSRADRKARADHLAGFLAEEAAGRLARHFLDQAMLSDWIDSARGDAERLDRELAMMAAPTASFLRSNAGWTMTLQIAEPATAILWRDPASGELVDNGLLSTVDMRTGKAMPNPNLALPQDQPRGPITVVYRDANGLEVGPFDILFDPDAQLFQGMRQMLEMQAPNWLATRDWEGDVLVYTTTLASFTCGIREARYGLDDAEPTTPVPLPRCDPTQPYAIPADYQPYFKLPKGTRTINLSLVWYDGTPARPQVYKVDTIKMP